MAKKSSSKGIGLDVATSMPRGSTAKQMQQEKRWQAEDDLRTLQRAAEIKSDRARMATAKSVATEQMKALARVAK